ncbi:MAG: hypothetical protein M1832_003256 [Thelocarpon impressellum]|nr:MAG: hypothetical protein M1832_003256 [Thelocarpon impressellum]
MALISGGTIIRSVSLFHLTLAYFFLNAPHRLGDQNLVFILGEAMGLPHVQAFDLPSAPSSFLAAVLAFLGISDLMAAALPDEISKYHWGNQGMSPPFRVITHPLTSTAPIRLLFFFCLTAYTYLAPTPAGSKSAAASSSSGLTRSHTPAAGNGLKNGMVFTWAFVEMVTWFWVYVTLRDERREASAKLTAKRKAEEDSL